MRVFHLSSSPADLYNEIFIPKGLSKARENNEKAVMKAYVFSEKIWIIFMALVFVTDIVLMFRRFSQAIAAGIVQNAELEMFF